MEITFIRHAEKEETVSIKNTKKLISLSENIKFVPLKNKGHISFSDLGINFILKFL